MIQKNNAVAEGFQACKMRIGDQDADALILKVMQGFFEQFVIIAVQRADDIIDHEQAGTADLGAQQLNDFFLAKGQIGDFHGR